MSQNALLQGKTNHTVVLRPKITSDIKAREPSILGRREEGGGEPRRHANSEHTIITLLSVLRVRGEEFEYTE